MYTEIKHKFTTMLGESDVIVQVDAEELRKNIIVFKPEEEERLMREQAVKFLNQLLKQRFPLSDAEIRFLIRLLER